jgi:hypothetical protein
VTERGDDGEFGVREELCSQPRGLVRRGVFEPRGHVDLAAAEGEDPGPGPSADRVGGEPVLALQRRPQRICAGWA